MENMILLAIAIIFIAVILGRRLSIMFDSHVKNVSASQAQQMVHQHSDMLILDVRTQEEYDYGHIPGAVLVPVRELAQRVNELVAYKEKPVLVYCASGGRSPGAVRILLSNHFTQIYHLYAGVSGWVYGLETD